MNKIDHIITSVRNIKEWTKEEKASFLSQVEHESMSFTHTVEMDYKPDRAFHIWGKRFKTLKNTKEIYATKGSDGLLDIAYGNRLGNKDPNDGSKYKGRGYIQVTGKDNYRQVEIDTGMPAVSQPELLETPEGALLSAIAWWNRNIHTKQPNFSNVEAVTKLVNGTAMLGLEDRKKKYDKWIKII